MVILALGLLPLLLSALVGLSATSLLISRQAELRHVCRVQALRLQDGVKQPLKELLALNSQAQRLMAAKKRLQIRLAATLPTGNAALIAYLETQIGEVLAKQVALRAQQQAILQFARLLDQRETLHLMLKLRAAGRGSVAKIAIQSHGLAVKPRELTEVAPVYELQQPFEVAQAINVHYRVHWETIWPLWLRQKMTTTGLGDEKCAASLRQEGRKWFAILTQA